MFFMMGIMPGRKVLNFNQLIICSRCGRYGHLSVTVTYTVLSLFFIPVFKWGRRYYAEASCCGTVYELDADLGRAIERGEISELRQEDLKPVDGTGHASPWKRCENCGYTTEEDFEFCPKCGKRFE